ncbi:MAG: LemA family protein [Succinimonas sp.]|nr:LemA family protein [Succinimonas sp.]
MTLTHIFYISVPLTLTIIVCLTCHLKHVKSKSQGLEAACMSLLSQIFALFKRKYAMIPRLNEKIREYASGENDLLKEIDKEATLAGVAAENLKRNCRAPGAFSELRNRENTIFLRMTALRDRLRRYPALLNTASYREISEELKAQDSKIDFNIRQYNDAAREFNDYCHRGLIRRLILKLLGVSPEAPLIEDLLPVLPEDNKESQAANTADNEGKSAAPASNN